MPDSFKPLAERIRPNTITQTVGQAHLIAESSALMRSLAARRPYSMVLWGSPGCVSVKTTMASLVASASGAELISISAVLAGVAELRAVVALRQLIV